MLRNLPEIVRKRGNDTFASIVLSNHKNMMVDAGSWSNSIITRTFYYAVCSLDSAVNRRIDL